MCTVRGHADSFRQDIKDSKFGLQFSYVHIAGCTKANLTSATGTYAAELAREEQAHVSFLFSALTAAGGSPKCPAVNIGESSSESYTDGSMKARMQQSTCRCSFICTIRFSVPEFDIPGSCLPLQIHLNRWIKLSLLVADPVTDFHPHAKNDFVQTLHLRLLLRLLS